MNYKWLLKHLVSLLVLMLLTLNTAVANEARHALIIGNSSYQQSPLPNPKNDARDLAKALKKLGFEVRIKIDADIGAMESALSDYADQLKRKGGVGLLYYAGHGVQANGENFLIPVDSGIQRASQIRRKALSLGQVMEELRLAGNGLNMVVLDACRDNPFPGEFRTAQRGLARIDRSPTGTFIAYATDPGATAADGDTQQPLQPPSDRSRAAARSADRAGLQTCEQ